MGKLSHNTAGDNGAPSIDEIIRARVRDEVRRQLAERVEVEWIPHRRWPWSRRKSLAIAHSGALEVRRVGRDFMARRADLDAYIARCGVEARPVAKAAAAPVDALDELDRKVGAR